MLLIFVNIIIPILAGIIFFFLAGYVKKIAPLRVLVTGSLTYKSAYKGFIFFGIYLASRPLQIILGPHPVPLIVNNIREFFMLGLFAPSVFIAMMSLVFGSENIKRNLIRVIYLVGVLLALSFVVINIYAIGGSVEIFKIGNYSVYDGIWFEQDNPYNQRLMSLLFLIRIIDPVFIIGLAGVIVLWKVFTYPKESVYNNMPKKLFYISLACFSFSVSMLFCGFIIVLWDVPNQWWIYYIGALFAGFFQLKSLFLPLSKEVKL